MSQILEVQEAQILEESPSTSTALTLYTGEGEDTTIFNAPSNDKALRHDVRAILEASGAAFRVSKVPLSIGGEGVFAGQRALLNNGGNAWGILREDTGTLFGMRTGRHTLMQTLDFADVMQPVVDSGLGEYDGTLVLDKGGTIVVRYKLQSIRITGDESPLDCYLNIVVNHDSKRACSIYLSTIRPVCRNTLNAGIAQAKGRGTIFTMKHLPNAMQKMEIANMAVAKASKAFAAFQERANRLATTKASLLDMARLSASLFPSDKEGDEVPKQTMAKREDLVRLFDSGTGITGAIRGTRWAMLQAVTEHTSHNLKVNVQDKEKQEAARAYHGMFGRGFDLQAQTMEILEVEGELVA